MPTEDTSLHPERPMRLWRFGSASLDEERRELSVSGEIRPIESRPLALLIELLRRDGDVASKSELMRAVWGEVNVVEGSLPTAISKLRIALGDDERTIIKSAPRIGYRIGVPISLETAPALRRIGLALAAGSAVPGRPSLRLERSLGDSGAVWLALGPGPDERRVLRFADTAEELDRLKEEWAASMSLAALGERPDIVRATGRDFEQRPFLIESGYAGVPLDDVPADNGPADARVAMVAAIARALAAAHGLGVLHGALSPRSIRLADDRRQAAIVEFGRQVAAYGAPYSAPELLRTPSATIATDIYALGILLYQAVVGDWERPLANGWQDEIDDPVLVDDIEAATAGDPARRLSSASLLAERLEQLATRRAERRAAHEAEARTAQLAHAAERARQRRPWMIGLFAALLLGLVGTTVAGIRAAQERNAAARQAAIAEAVQLFLTEDLLGRGNPLRSGKPDETLMEAVLHIEPEIKRRLHAEPVIAASIYAAVATAFDDRSAFGSARMFYPRAISAYEAAEGPHSEEATVLRLRWATMEAETGEPEGQSKARALLAAAELPPGKDAAQRSKAETWALAARSMLAIISNDLTDALTLTRAAADAADAMPGAFDAETRLDLREHELVTLIRTNALGQAASLLGRLERQASDLNGPDHPMTLLIAIDRLRLDYATGAVAAAETLGASLCPRVAEAFGPNAHHTMICQLELASAEIAVGRYTDAVRDEDEAYQAILATQGPRSYLAMVAASNAGEAACRAADTAEGISRLGKVLAVARSVLGDQAPSTEMAKTQLAICLTLAGQFGAANALFASVDPSVVDRASDRADTKATIDVAKAAEALAAGDVASARRLIEAPAREVADPEADPWLRGWVVRLQDGIAKARARPTDVTEK